MRPRVLAVLPLLFGLLMLPFSWDAARLEAEEALLVWGSTSTREDAVARVEAMGADGFPVLLLALNDRDFDIRRQALRALLRAAEGAHLEPLASGSPAWISSALRRGLADRDARIRAAAAGLALASHPDLEPRALAILLIEALHEEMLSDGDLGGDAQVSFDAIKDALMALRMRAGGVIGSATATARPGLARALVRASAQAGDTLLVLDGLSHRDASVRMAAARALELGLPSEGYGLRRLGVQALVERTEDPDEEVRYAVIRALRHLGVGDLEAREALARIRWRCVDFSVRDCARYALAELAEELAVADDSASERCLHRAFFPQSLPPCADLRCCPSCLSAERRTPGS